jgi:hypothetical protein
MYGSVGPLSSLLPSHSSIIILAANAGPSSQFKYFSNGLFLHRSSIHSKLEKFKNDSVGDIFTSCPENTVIFFGTPPTTFPSSTKSKFPTILSKSGVEIIRL